MRRRMRVVLVGVIAIVVALLVVVSGGRGRGQRAARERERAVEPRAGAGDAGALGRGAPGVVVAQRRAAVVARDDEPTGTVRIEGLVLDEAGRPVAGAELEVSSVPPRRLRADSDGSFAIDGLWPRRYVLRAWTAERYAAPIEFVARATTEPIVVHLRRGNVVTVTVVDAATERPIVGATVDDQRAVARTDAAGRVTLRGQYATMVIVRIAHPDYAPVVDGWLLSDDPDGVAEHTTRLVRGAAVAGTVRAADGRAVAQARVRLAGPRSQLEAETDAAGRFAFAHVEPGRYAATAEQVGYSPGAVEVECPESGLSEVALVLAREARLDGVVVDAAGDGVEGARVVIDGGEVTERAVVTGAGGRFAIAGLARAGHVVTATHGGAAAAPIAIELTHEDTAAARLTLAEGTIAGVVVDAAGAPVAEARVLALPTAPGPVFASGGDVTDGRGRFAIDELAPGRYALRAAWPEAGATAPGGETEAATGATGVRVVLAATGAISGVVTRDGRPVAHYAVALEPSAIGDGARVIRAGDARFTRARLAPGVYTVTIVGPGFARRVLRDVAVTAGGVTELGPIAVDAGREIRGRVVDRLGAAVGGAEVAIGPALSVEDGSFAGARSWAELQAAGQVAATSDADGAFVVRGVDAGPLQIAATHRRLGTSAPRALGPDASPITLVLEPPPPPARRPRTAPGAADQP